MRVTNHELIVRRNETFTIDKLVVNRDDSPYIISSRLKNPYFVITVSSSLYLNDDSYVYYAWLPITIPRFYTTVPVCVNDFKDVNGNSIYNGFSTMTGPPSGYVNGIQISYGEDNSDLPCYDALFYYEDMDGNRTYKWWSGEGGWKDYECRIIHKFLQQYTRDWIEHGYYYNIELVDGTKNLDAKDGDRPLIDICEVIPILEPTKVSVQSNLKGGMRWLK